MTNLQSQRQLRTSAKLRLLIDNRVTWNRVSYPWGLYHTPGECDRKRNTELFSPLIEGWTKEYHYPTRLVDRVLGEEHRPYALCILWPWKHRWRERKNFHWTMEYNSSSLSLFGGVLVARTGSSQDRGVVWTNINSPVSENLSRRPKKWKRNSCVTL